MLKSRTFLWHPHRNTERTDAFEGALDEATGMGLQWAKKFTRQRREAMDKKDMSKGNRLPWV